ncbi:hypothetical protein DEH69_00500 [Streptomyces sp. PT12]|nr:hypothetical protein DEH69_00500 [Streptomyces sp. PT12]
MRWDEANGEWVADNRGNPGTGDGLPATGEPGSYGYDENGNRPDCGPSGIGVGAGHPQKRGS